MPVAWQSQFHGILGSGTRSEHGSDELLAF
jgi:hypothetical protein